MGCMSRGILLAEDNLGHQRLIRALLEDASFHVEVASDGAEALRKGLEGPFDLIVSDQKMPGITGEQVAAVLHRFQPGTPIILVSAAPIDPDSPMPDGVRARFQKPVPAADLLAAVHAALKPA